MVTTPEEDPWELEKVSACETLKKDKYHFRRKPDEFRLSKAIKDSF